MVMYRSLNRMLLLRGMTMTSEMNLTCVVIPLKRHINMADSDCW